MNICSVNDCSSKIKARGFCDKHWKRWRNGKSLTEKSMFEKTVEERFWSYVEKLGVNDCWNWMGSTRGSPGRMYGMIWDKKHISAHRFSYELHFGEIPLIDGVDYRGACVLHKCDNPLCVNPKHLFVGSHTDNMRDKIAKKRDSNANKTHCIHGHERNETNTYVTKTGLKACRVCHKLRQRRITRNNGG